MKQIVSRDNATFKHLRSLAEDARYRRKEGATLLDGVHLVQAACAADVPVRRLLFTATSIQTVEIAALAERLGASDCELIELSEGLLRALSPVETPSGVLAEILVPASVVTRGGNDMLLIEGVQDAGNLGTLLRTAAAAGIRRIVLSEHCAQAWSPKVLRAGMGAHFSLEIAEQANLIEVLDGWSGAVLGTALHEDARDLFALDLRGAIAWMFGSEGRGLSEALLGRATHLVRIPMSAGTESLNVAAAAAVCLFEQFRQRRA